MSYAIGAGCDGCSACSRQCPVDAISGTYKSRYDIDDGLCVDCGVCGVVCPVEAVTDAEGRVVSHVPRPQRPRPVLDATRCNGCETCVAFCPFECRRIVGAPHRGVSMMAEPGRCVACGECSRSCIKGAISMRRIDLPGYDPGSEQRSLEALLGAADRAPSLSSDPPGEEP